MTDSIVLFGHGSRDPLWHRPIEAVAERIRATAPEVRVACAYLELSAPDLPTTVDRLVAEGARAIRIVPMFLGVGKHAREDLPLLVEGLRRAHPGVAIGLTPAVGEHPRLIDAIAHIATAGTEA